MTITSTLPTHLAHDRKIILEKAKRHTVREPSRKTPDSLGAKPLTASTALRAYRNWHLGTLMRCCETWEPVAKCYDPISFECIDFHVLSQISASLTRENLAEREAEIGNLPWTQTEKDNALAKCMQTWTPRLACQETDMLLPMKMAILWKTKTNLAGDHVNIGVQSFRRASKVKDTTTMRTSCDTFRKLLTTSAGKSTKMSLTNSWPQRRNLLLALMAFRTAYIGVRWDWVRRFCSTHTTMCWRVVLSLRFLTKSRTVFVPKSSDVDNNGRIVRSPEALRPLTLCNCDCKILTTAICRGLHWCTMRCIHPSQRCISSRL